MSNHHHKIPTPPYCEITAEKPRYGCTNPVYTWKGCRIRSRYRRDKRPPPTPPPPLVPYPTISQKKTSANPPHTYPPPPPSAPLLPPKLLQCSLEWSDSSKQRFPSPPRRPRPSLHTSSTPKRRKRIGGIPPSPIPPGHNSHPSQKQKRGSHVFSSTRRLNPRPRLVWRE